MKFKEVRLTDTDIEIIDGDRGKNYPKTTDFLPKGHTLFLNNKNIINNYLDDSFGNYISEEKSNALKKGKLNRHDIVMSTRGSVGNIGFFSNRVKHENIRINSGMVILRNTDEEIDTEYLYILLKSQLMKNRYSELVTGSVQNQLPIKDLEKLYLIVPTLAAQNAIKKIVKSLDKKIEVNNQIISSLEVITSSVFKHWFVDFEWSTP